MLSKKLCGETGASFIIALFVFLICAVVASVIVMSASGNVERIQQHRIEEQAYLTMSSAAQMLQADLNANPSFTGTESMKIFGCHGEDIDDAECEDENDGYRNSVANHEETQLSGYIEQAAEQVYQSHLQYEDSVMFTSYQRSFSIEVNDMGTVQAVMTMDSDYNIQIVLTSDSDDYRYEMILTAPASVSIVSASKVIHNDCEHYKWEKVQVFWWWEWWKILKSFDSTTYTITTEVTWPLCTISKGSAVS